jgi:tRNA(Ile)-lysidine synthase
MKVNLAQYADKKICVAVSGGRDSMALLHYIYTNAEKYNISLCALNCDHGLRGDESARDSAFVKEWCVSHGIPLIFFKSLQPFKNEAMARMWRIKCYICAVAPQSKLSEAKKILEESTEGAIYPSAKSWQGADAVATAHHLNDNAETVLFNLARGSSLAGLTGITDHGINGIGGGQWREIRPLIECSRAEIDKYVKDNDIPFVTDSTNLTDVYTRNYIRHNVLPQLEHAVPGAAKAIYRFSRLAAADEEYFSRQVEKIICDRKPYGFEILHCEEPVIFKRAAVEIINRYGCRDYTSQQAQRLYDLQFAKVGKKFEFLGLTAFKEEGMVTIVADEQLKGEQQVPYIFYLSQLCDNLGGQLVKICMKDELNKELEYLKEFQASGELPKTLKVLHYDCDKMPPDTAVRFKRPGDKFKKFGGGTKSLSDYFTDKKIPARLRGCIPLIVNGEHEVLAVGGVEISNSVKITDTTVSTGCIICADYLTV